jgi:hypothetical protein
MRSLLRPVDGPILDLKLRYLTEGEVVRDQHRTRVRPSEAMSTLSDPNGYPEWSTPACNLVSIGC